MKDPKTPISLEIKEAFIASIIFIVVFISAKMLLYLGATFIWDVIDDMNPIVNWLGYILIGFALGDSFLILTKIYQRILLILCSLLIVLVIFTFGYFISYLEIRHDVRASITHSRSETTKVIDQFYINETGHAGFIGFFHYELQRVIDKEQVRAELGKSSMEDEDMIVIEKASYWILVEAADTLGMQCNGLFTFIFWYIIGLIFVTTGFFLEYDSGFFKFPSKLKSRKRRKMVRLTGTNIFLSLPSKFKPQMHGGAYSTSQSIVFAYAQKGNYAHYNKTFIDGLIRNNVKKDFSKNITVGGLPGFYLESSEKKHKTLFLTFGDDEMVTMLYGNCKTKYQQRKLRKIFKKLYFDTLNSLDTNEIDDTGGLIRSNIKALMSR